MSNYAIRVEGLGKQYTIGAYQGRYKSLRDSLMRSFTEPLRRIGKKNGTNDPERTIWALKDVSFDIEHGEVVGIIGRNGAGKSTLLKLLARITEPTEGLIRMRGRVGSLLEVGTGFHPELTGRENIFLNGAILGMGRVEIQRKFDEIVDFAEIEKFIDTPAKHYSSGMYMRLAFAVAAHLEPEILLVDEVLAVGDAQFQKKCLGKMGDVAKEGRTVLFVSHNMAAVQNLCPKSFLLNEGNLSQFGPTSKVIELYVKSFRNHRLADIEKATVRQGNGRVRFVKVYFEDGESNIVDQAVAGLPITIGIQYRSLNGPLPNCRISLAFYDIHGQVLFNCSSELTTERSLNLPASGVIRCHIPQFPLSQSEYIIAPFFEVNGEVADYIPDGIRINVIDGDFYGTGKLYPPGWQGKGVLIRHEWAFE